MSRDRRILGLWGSERAEIHPFMPLILIKVTSEASSLANTCHVMSQDILETLPCC
jgi:hypothetical protein